MLKSNVPILIYANKADMKDGAPLEEIKSILKVQELKFPVKVFRTSVLTGEGLEEGIVWFATLIKQRLEKEKSSS